MRVATIPTRFGERVTLRLLSPLQDTPSLAELGMGKGQLDLFTRAIASSNGLVLLTGPTGCGKSTTLYTAIMQLLKTRGGNVITVEDPIEYEIPGTTQVEVDSTEKVSFSRALRSILRHDPDVIMLGEIRDAETAEMAIKASLTGHLVFSTLHTNTAAGVVTRLLDMGVEPFLIAATLRLAVAQRLVRRLCPRCRSLSRLSETDAAALGRPELSGQESYQSTGCVYCAGKGFVKRMALFEMLPGGNETADLISGGATEADLLELMRRSNQPMLLDDGINKVLAGTTTAHQVLSAVGTW
jgi:type II secretory ATPase GspE/PulE/Tfp pilus assembly ATPase PilB-like protein